MSDALRYGLLLSFLTCVAVLSIQVLKTRSFGRGPLFAAPRGNSVKGVLYAFGRGMLPWEKESARDHLPTYLAGVAYHAGIFAAGIYLLCLVVRVGLSAQALSFLRLLLIVGLLGGVGLLLKRIATPNMRKLSCPDDYAANLIVDGFLLLALLDTFLGRTGGPASSTRVLYVFSIIMFLYVPVGKIRHCFFFFYVRVLFGRFYGRRNILPPRTHVA